MNDYEQQLSELKPGDEVLLGRNTQIYQVKRLTKLYIVVQVGNSERRYRKEDGFEPGSYDTWSFNRSKLIPVTDEIRARIKLEKIRARIKLEKNEIRARIKLEISRALLKDVFDRNYKKFDQASIDEFTARFHAYEK